MSFVSLQFVLLLSIVFVLYWAVPNKYRWILLFIASYIFYMSWNAKYVVLILVTTLASYLCAIGLERTEAKQIKKLMLVITLLISLGILFVFKYYNFCMDSFAAACSWFSLELHPTTLRLLLPVGISFYTFQTLSYVIDVYRGDVKAERHFGKYATFIAFFPQLVAGPIERTRNLLPQITGEHKFSYEKATAGLKLMAWGAFKKMVIADRLAVYVDQVYENITDYQGFTLVLAAFFFTFQIYCDFSGYSDIAIGTAKLLDIDLMTNFKSPYFSASIKEFWSRWHISLSTWFRDYVYIPLGGNRCGAVRRGLNLMITFLVSGLWHGASWNYVIWGGVHGLCQILEKGFTKTKAKQGSIRWWISVMVVFAFAVFTWVFFRANTFADVQYFFANAFNGIRDLKMYLYVGYKAIAPTEMDEIRVKMMFVMIAILMGYDYASLKVNVWEKISKWNIVARYAIYLLLVVVVLVLRATAEATFVYFQF